VVAVGAVPHLVGRHGLEDGDHGPGEAHVEVPLVVDLEGPHAAGDRVVRDLRELRLPVRVHRPSLLEVAPGPLHEEASGLPLRHLDGVVDEADAHPLRDDGLHPIEMGEDHVPGAAVGVGGDRRRAIEDRGVLRPSALVDDGVDREAARVQALREEVHPGRVLVGARAVASAPGHQDDLLLAVGCGVGCGVRGRVRGRLRGRLRGRGQSGRRSGGRYGVRGEDGGRRQRECDAGKERYRNEDAHDFLLGKDPVAVPTHGWQADRAVRLDELSCRLLCARRPDGSTSGGTPNFLLIFTDDHGYGDVSTYHESDVRTPNIDRIAAEGMLFTRCGPTAPSARRRGRRCSPGATPTASACRA
jgi:hypothetical protein